MVVFGEMITSNMHLATKAEKAERAVTSQMPDPRGKLNQSFQRDL